MKADEIYCYLCGEPRSHELDWRCNTCGGPFTISQEKTFDPRRVVTSNPSMWRYSHVFPTSTLSPVSLGEGNTPIVKTFSHNIWMKLDYVTPTASFKDRGASMVISHIKKLINRHEIEYVVEDSSGNAAASIAAYASHAGLRCKIFSPQTILEAKAEQILSFEAELKRVAGGREEATSAALAAVEKAYYAGHIWNPYFIEGTKTVAYEVAEHFRWDSPDAVFVPASSGTLLLGVIYGFETLRDSGVIDRLPKVVAAQPENVAPLYTAFYGLETSVQAAKDTVADALRLTNPPRLPQMVRELQACGGEVVTVSEQQVKRATRELGGMGFSVEPSASVGYAALRTNIEEVVESGEEVVVILTGSGLKSRSVS